MSSKTLTRTNEPPGKPTNYVIPCYGGELWTIPTSNSVMRLLVTGKETEGAFAVVGSGGTFGDPIGFHYHKEAHDVFLCIKGTMNVWANDQARELGPGDFASVPPGTIHQYQLTSPHTENIGLIIPGFWEEFFRHIADPYTSGPLFPSHDTRSPFQVLIPRLISASEKYDMIPCRDKAHFSPQPWSSTENILPGTCSEGGYFLKADTGPKWEVGGYLIKPLITTKESYKGKFSIYAVEGSERYKELGIQKTQWRFGEIHHAVFVAEGEVVLVVEGEESRVGTGETAFMPKGTKWGFRPGSLFFKGYFFANGGGVGGVLTSEGVGRRWEWAVLPEEGDVGEGKVDLDVMKGLKGEFGFEAFV